MNFSEEAVNISNDLPPGSWEKLLDSASTDWDGEGSNFPQQLGKAETFWKDREILLNPYSAVVYSN